MHKLPPLFLYLPGFFSFFNEGFQFLSHLFICRAALVSAAACRNLCLHRSKPFVTTLEISFPDHGQTRGPRTGTARKSLVPSLPLSPSSLNPCLSVSPALTLLGSRSLFLSELGYFRETIHLHSSPGTTHHHYSNTDSFSKHGSYLKENASLEDF